MRYSWEVREWKKRRSLNIWDKCYGNMEGQCRVIGTPGRIVKGRNITMEVKRGLRNSIVLPTLMYTLET